MADVFDPTFVRLDEIGVLGDGMFGINRDGLVALSTKTVVRLEMSSVFKSITSNFFEFDSITLLSEFTSFIIDLIDNLSDFGVVLDALSDAFKSIDDA